MMEFVLFWEKCNWHLLYLFNSQCLQGLVHWKTIVDTLCRSDAVIEGQSRTLHDFLSGFDLVILRESLMLEFFKAFRFQLELLPNDFFTDNLSKDNFLTSAIPQLTSTLTECASETEVHKHKFDIELKQLLCSLKELLVQKFGFEPEVLATGVIDD